MATIVKQAFRSYPWLANSITYGTLLVGAEFSQQVYNKKLNKKPGEVPEPFDTGALLRYAIVGTAVNPTILYFWYKWLDRRYVGTALKIVTKKVLLDQFVMTPPLYAAFFTTLSLLERKDNIFEEFKLKFFPTFATSCIFWLPAQTFNFALVPNSGRIVYISTCSFLWMNILCYIKRRDF